MEETMRDSNELVSLSALSRINKSKFVAIFVVIGIVCFSLAIHIGYVNNKKEYYKNKRETKRHAYHSLKKIAICLILFLYKSISYDITHIFLPSCS
jgi:hypothetical protein